MTANHDDRYWHVFLAAIIQAAVRNLQDGDVHVALGTLQLGLAEYHARLDTSARSRTVRAA